MEQIFRQREGGGCVMNGDFGASVEDGAQEEHSGQASSVNSPAAKWFAPAKQPLRTQSGKHWSKSRRGELGVGNSSPEEQEVNTEGKLGEQVTKQSTIGVDKPTSAAQSQVQGSKHDRRSPITLQTETNTVQNSVTAVAGKTDQRASGAGRPAAPGENPMRKPSSAAKELPVLQQPQQPAQTTAAAAEVPSPLIPSTQTSMKFSSGPSSTQEQASFSPAAKDVVQRGGPPQPRSALSRNDSARVSMSNLYDKPVSYKYLPLEMASAAPVKNSIAKNILFQSLGHGLLVIKHGKWTSSVCAGLGCYPTLDEDRIECQQLDMHTLG
jgi:hypothetical protein